MASNQAWATIISKLSENRLEFPTVPKTKKSPVWFSASTDGLVISISEAAASTPSSKLSMERKLTYGIFEKVYPYYIRRENGDKVSKVVTKITVDQVYYYSLIKHLVGSM